MTLGIQVIVWDRHNNVAGCIYWFGILGDSFQQESVQISFFSENKDNAFSDDKSSHGQGGKKENLW